MRTGAPLQGLRLQGRQGLDRSAEAVVCRLHTAGLAIRKVQGDGNCWFRSLADQLQVQHRHRRWAAALRV